MKKSPPPEQIEEPSESPASPARRSLLRGTVTAMPALLTLQSGAALARSSNVIGAASSNNVDAKGRTLCLDTESVTRVNGTDALFDLGDPASGRVSAINDRRYHLEPRRKSTRVSEADMCEGGGTYYYRDRRRGGGRRWKSVHVKQGVIVSATALTSFAGSIHVYDL